MKPFLKDNRADSFAILFMTCLLLMFSILYIVTSHDVINPLSDIMNDRISAGTVSEQTAWWYSLTVKVWIAAPLFFLIGWMLWGIVRANETEDIAE